MKPIIIVDTNVILRLILADNPKLSLQSKEIFDLAETGKIDCQSQKEVNFGRS